LPVEAKPLFRPDVLHPHLATFRLGPSKNNVQLHSESCPDSADGPEAKLEVVFGWPLKDWDRLVLGQAHKDDHFDILYSYERSSNQGVPEFHFCADGEIDDASRNLSS
jgi:hypothetical protein